MRKYKISLNNNNQIINITENSEYQINYIGAPDSKIKQKIEFVHNSPDIYSRIYIKAIILGNAHFDLEGILKIHKGAYNTDTYLKIECLVVGDNAYARAIPSLEIHESAVKGGHGATIGYIDENHLNYLYSRGLSKKLSEELIIKAFMEENK